MSWEIFVGPTITVLGWFVGAMWAIHQVRLAHEKARRLQYEVIAKSHQDALLNKTVDLLLLMNQSIERFRGSCSLLLNAMAMHNVAREDLKASGPAIEIEYEHHIPEIREAYLEVSSSLERLQVWRSVAPRELLDASGVDKCISELVRLFRDRNANKTGSTWLHLQMTLVGIQAQGAHRAPRMQKIWEPFSTDLKAIQRELIALVAQAHAKLVDERRAASELALRTESA